MKKKTELKVGDIWGVLPLERTLEIRVICFTIFEKLQYTDIGRYLKTQKISSFHSWITHKKAVLIGHYDFKTGKAMKGKRNG